jgi:kinetochore protein Nuf2
MSQPAFSGINALNYPELHEESIPELAFFRACSKMMSVCGVHDFSMKDLLAPEAKRVRRHLSAIINFAKFREERLVMYSELAVKRDQLLDTLKRLQEEEAAMGKELSLLQEQTAAEAGEMTRLEQGCEVAEAELEELNHTQATIRAEGSELKKQSQELKESLAKATHTLETAIEEKTRTQAQIVRSPARVRKELQDVAKEVEAEKAEGLGAERDAREMNLRVAAVVKGEKEVSGFVCVCVCVFVLVCVFLGIGQVKTLSQTHLRVCLCVFACSLFFPYTPTHPHTHTPTHTHRSAKPSRASKKSRRSSRSKNWRPRS